MVSDNKYLEYLIVPCWVFYWEILEPGEKDIKEYTERNRQQQKSMTTTKISTAGIKPKFCYRCGKKIDLESNYLKVITMNKKKTIEEIWFHLPCWQDFNQDKVTARLQGIVRKGLSSLALYAKD